MNFGGDCKNTEIEEQKHYVYAKKMQIPLSKKKDKDKPFDGMNKKILDIGSGPVSMLLKCDNLASGSKVIDPLMYRFPQWVRDRYKDNNIDFECNIAEDLDISSIFDQHFDEVWIYNVLQHTKSPSKIIENIKKCVPVIRMFEWVLIPSDDMHLHTLSKSSLEEDLGQLGRVEYLATEDNVTFNGEAFYGVFCGDDCLGSLFMKYKSDKYISTPESHLYFIKYEQLFSKLRRMPIKLFEMGIGSTDPNITSNMSAWASHFGYTPGASHKSWAEYFSHPDSEIYGGDIDSEICGVDYGPKIFTTQMDQTSEESLNNFFTPDKKEYFDIILDDGLHIQSAAQCLLKHSWHTLKKNCWYIIEDIDLDINSLADIIDMDKNPVEKWGMIRRDGFIVNNYLIVIQKLED